MKNEEIKRFVAKSENAPAKFKQAKCDIVAYPELFRAGVLQGRCGID